MPDVIKVLCALMVVLGLVTEAAMSAEPKPSGLAGDETNIREVLEGVTEAWNRHDAEAFAMAFAEDADFTNVRGVSAHGRANIAKFHAPVFATIFKESSLKISDVKIRFINPNVAAVDEWWEMTGARDRDGHEIPLRRGLLNLSMTKQDAQWVILVMHNMDLPVSP